MHLLSDTVCLFAWALLVQNPGPFYVASSFANGDLSKTRRIRDVNNNTGEARVEKCLPNESPCVSICCQPGWYYKKSSCIHNDSSPASELQFPKIHDDDLQPLNRSVSEFTRVYHAACEYGHTFLDPEISEDMFYFLDDGSLYLPNCFDGKKYATEDYCLTSNLETNGSVTKVMVCNERDRSSEILYVLYPVTMMLSIPFFIATIIVYTIVPALRNLHGLCLRIQMTVLALTYLLLTVLMIVDIEELKKTVLCKIVAAIDYFLYLGNFFWLNILCIDIWWTFGGFRKLQVREKQQDGKLFLIYSLYAWGSVSFLTAVCIAMDYVPKTFMSAVPRPEFGAKNCWFRTREATNLYFYGPMGLTVFCNICLFIMITVKLIQHERNTASQLKSKDSQRHNENKQRFHVCIKLLVLMGLNWSMELISWSVDNNPAILWTIIDMGNTLQGVILFFLLVCNARVKGLLLKRLGWKDFSSWTFSRSTEIEVSDESNKSSHTKETYHSNPAYEQDEGA